VPPKTGISHVIVTEVADLLPPLKRLLVNSVIKYVKKMVPAYHLPQAVKFNDALAKGMARAWRSQPKQRRWPCCNTPAAPPAWPRAPC
jgi:long-chain acyl-CoA synthetase